MDRLTDSNPEPCRKPRMKILLYLYFSSSFILCIPAAHPPEPTLETVKVDTKCDLSALNKITLVLLPRPARTQQIYGLREYLRVWLQTSYYKGSGCKTRWMKGNTNPLVKANKDKIGTHPLIFRKIWGKATNLPSQPPLCSSSTNQPPPSWGGFVHTFIRLQIKIMSLKLCGFYAVIQLVQFEAIEHLTLQQLFVKWC